MLKVGVECMDIYDHKKQIASAEKRIIEANYSEYNKEKIFEFVNTLYAQGLSNSRIVKYLIQLNILSGWLGKDFKDATKTDMYKS